MSTSTEAPATDGSVSADSADSADSPPPMEDVQAAPGAFIGRIYRISAPSFGDRVYVGSTRKTLSARLLQHQRSRRQWERGVGDYVTSYELVGRSDVEIDLIEEEEFADVQHMRDREAYWIARLPSVNKCTPGRSDAESHRISLAARVPCGTCGKIVRRSEHWNHQRSRACMLAAFNRRGRASGS
jgi:hypothetical protein